MYKVLIVTTFAQSESKKLHVKYPEELNKLLEEGWKVNEMKTVELGTAKVYDTWFVLTK